MRCVSALCACLLFTATVACNKPATVTANQCLAGDWETLGYRDGFQGRHHSQRLPAHQDACMEHGSVPDRATYLRGWEQGIGEYCQADNGFSQGMRGVSYRNVCPAAIEADFLAGYRDGRKIHHARVVVSELEEAISYRERRLSLLESELIRTGNRQLKPDVTASQHVEGIVALKRILEERFEIKEELPELRAELDTALHELERLERSLVAASD